MLVTLVVDLPGATYAEAIGHLRENPYSLSRAHAYPGDLVTTLQKQVQRMQQQIIEQEATCAGVRAIINKIF